ncbi:hypothetical protein BC830DRAFT_1068192 [Chytriomyces sp. MP71]|nr:hypothetical protein BC830DRAFT_1068192 [Chytriomyces sp. MP71]
MEGIPELPSVWAAIDTLQLCYTAIPQAKHYYRYGTFRDCAPARKELAFALSLKAKSIEEATQLVKEREENKFKAKLTQRTSDGIWKLRTEPPPNFPPRISRTQ